MSTQADQDYAKYLALQCLQETLTATMMEFMALATQEAHKVNFDAAYNSLKMMGDYSAALINEQKADKQTTLDLSVESAKAQIYLMKAVLDKAKREHPYFNVEIAKEIERLALEAHDDSDDCHKIELWSDGEVSMNRRMLEPPIAGLQKDKVTFPGIGTGGMTYVSFTRDNNSYSKLRSMMIKIISK
jgi:hypothetical protein